MDSGFGACLVEKSFKLGVVGIVAQESLKQQGSFGPLMLLEELGASLDFLLGLGVFWEGGWDVEPRIRPRQPPIPPQRAPKRANPTRAEREKVSRELGLWWR